MAAQLERLQIQGDAALLKQDLLEDYSEDASALLESLGARTSAHGGEPYVVAQIDGDVVDASKPQNVDDGGGDDPSRMLVFDVVVGPARRRAFERRPLAATRAEFVAGAKVKISTRVGAVEELLALTPETAACLGGGRRPAPPRAIRPNPDGPPRFEPFDPTAIVEARAPVERREKPKAGLAGLDRGERRTLRLPVDGLAYDGGLRATVGGEVAAAAPPLDAFLFKGQDGAAVLPKLRPYFLGKTLALDLERTADGALVLHNLS